MRRVRLFAVAAVATVALIGGAWGALAAGLVRTPATDFVWARHHAREALSVDFLAAAKAIQAVREERGRPPRDLDELVAALDRGALRHTRLTAEGWVDPWGRPIVYRARRMMIGMGWSVRLYSVGRNGQDDAGYGDDVALDARMPEAARLLGGYLERR